MEYPAVLVGAKCVEWYSCIIQNEYDNATLLFEEVSEMIQSMEHDDKVIAYFQLLKFRYDLLLNKSNVSIDVTSSDISDSEPYLNYMYYFFSGQKEFYEGRYTAALRLFSVAEKLLNSVSDQYERGEFYLRIANGYYRLNQYVFAVEFLNKALDIFKQETSYKNKWLNGQLLMAGIETETNQFEKAQSRFGSAIHEAKAFPKVRALLFQGLAFNQLQNRNLADALENFNNALEIEHHATSNAGMKSKGEVAFIYLRLNEFDLALPYLEETENWAKKRDNIEYIAKCSIYRNFYLEKNDSKVHEGLNLLKEAELYFEMREIAHDLAYYYEKAGDYRQAVVFLKLALDMKDKQILLGGSETNEEA